MASSSQLPKMLLIFFKKKAHNYIKHQIKKAATVIYTKTSRTLEMIYLCTLYASRKRLGK